MKLGRYKQAPGENRKRGIDYTDFLESSEVVTAVTISVTPVTDTPLVVGSVAIDPDGKEFAYFASGGEDGVSYTATFRIVTNGGQVKKDTVDFDIEVDE